MIALDWVAVSSIGTAGATLVPGSCDVRVGTLGDTRLTSVARHWNVDRPDPR